MLELDENFQWHASKFAIFYKYKNSNLHLLFFISCYFIFPPNEYPGQCRDRPGHSLGENKVVARNENKLYGFSYSKSMAYFEAFPWNISSSINFLFLKSEKISFFKKLTACWIFLNSFLLVPRGTNWFGLSTLMGVEWDGDPSWTHWKKPKDNTLIIICF